MSKMLSKMNLISAVQQLPKEDIETIQGYVEMIEEENQELKLQLSGTTHCFDEEEHRELKKQNQELKKQLENTINSYTEEHNLRHNSDLKLDVLNTQQKEFILYLEDEIKNINPKEDDDEEEVYRVYGYDEMVKYIMLKEILKKYKSIIGDDK